MFAILTTDLFSQVIIHPASAGYVDDIALIQVVSPVTFNSAVQPICLPCGETLRPGKKCFVTGFGRTGGTLDDCVTTYCDVFINNYFRRTFNNLLQLIKC